MMHVRPALVALLLVLLAGSGHVSAYPLDGCEYTGLYRVEAQRLVLIREAPESKVPQNLTAPPGLRRLHRA